MQAATAALLVASRTLAAVLHAHFSGCFALGESRAVLETSSRDVPRMCGLHDGKHKDKGFECRDLQPKKWMSAASPEPHVCRTGIVLETEWSRSRAWRLPPLTWRAFWRGRRGLVIDRLEQTSAAMSTRLCL